MHHGLHLAAPDLLGAAALGERRDGANGLRVRLLLQDRLEVAVQAAELGGERLLRRRAPRGHSLRRLFLEMNQEEPQQVSGLPGWDARGLTCFRRVRGLRPPRLEVPECGRDIVTYLGAGRKVVDVAFDHGFLDSRSSPQHHARVRIASINCDTNGLPSTAISASGARSSAASENATLKRSRSLKNARSPWGKLNRE